MFKANSNYSLISESYLFSTVARRVEEYKAQHPEADILKLGIGDVTLPVCDAAVSELIAAARSQGLRDTFIGYGLNKVINFSLT